MDEKTLLTDLAEIIAIPSVYSAPTPDAPYGEDCRRALEWFVDKARAYGLNAANVDNRCAYAEYGDGGECIGILAHLDVVPAGNGWATDPFKMVEEGGKVYGRGVGDDKGSAVVCLHVLKELKDRGVKLRRRVRLIVGSDEERGSSCIAYYKKKGEELPVASFVPDSEFPVINSEKGISHMRFDFNDGALAAEVCGISGAACQNAVPDRSVLKLVKGGKLEAALKAACGGVATAEAFKLSPAVENIVSGGASPDDFSLENARDGITITAEGTAEHASTPEKGDNALWKTLGLLAAYNGVIGSKNVVDIYETLCTPLATEKLGIYVDDPKSGDLTACMSMADIKDGTLSLTVDFRLPLGVSAESVAQAVENKLGCKANILDYHPNLFIDEDAPLIKTLLKVYRGITGDMTAPLKTGGGTYARELPNAVAFGCTPLDIDINMHRADENFPVAQLFKNFEIYYAAAVALAEEK